MKIESVPLPTSHCSVTYYFFVYFRTLLKSQSGMCRSKNLNFNVHLLSDLFYLTQRPHNHLHCDTRIHTWHLTHERFSVYLGIYNGTYYLSKCIRGMLTSHNNDDTNSLTRTLECHHPNGDPWKPPMDHKWVLEHTFPSTVGICYDRTKGTTYYQSHIRVVVGKTRGSTNWQIITHHPYS